ncbi:hypothetical protein C8R45DRAFT_1209271, partial [Mycena sanguinolenta]
MKLFTFVSIAFVAFQVGVTANPIANPMPVPAIGSPVVDRAIPPPCETLKSGMVICI